MKVYSLFLGTEFDDKISLSSGLIIFGQSIGVATDQSGFDDSDGVLGYVSENNAQSVR